MRRWNRLALVGLMLGACAACVGEKPGEKLSDKSKDTAPVKLAEKPGEKPSTKAKDTAPVKLAEKSSLALTAEDIVKEFVKDGKAAEKKYKDKRIELTGTVRQAHGNLITKEGNATLAGPADGLGSHFVIARASESSAVQACLLTKGQKVAVVGTVQIGEGTPITLTECTYKELTASTAIEGTAEAISKEYDQDLEAVKQKYDDKEVIVTGVVDRTESKDGLNVIVLKGVGKSWINFGASKEEMASVKPGQTVRVKGTVGSFGSGDFSIVYGVLVPVR